MASSDLNVMIDSLVDCASLTVPPTPPSRPCMTPPGGHLHQPLDVYQPQPHLPPRLLLNATTCGVALLSGGHSHNALDGHQPRPHMGHPSPLAALPGTPARPLRFSAQPKPPVRFRARAAGLGGVLAGGSAGGAGCCAAGGLYNHGVPAAGSPQGESAAAGGRRGGCCFCNLGSCCCAAALLWWLLEGVFAAAPRAIQLLQVGGWTIAVVFTLFSNTWQLLLLVCCDCCWRVYMQLPPPGRVSCCRCADGMCLFERGGCCCAAASVC